MIPDNNRIVPPDLCTVLDNNSSLLKNSMNCVSIGTIQVFYPTDQTADILLNYKRWQGSDIAPLDYPLLVKCPVFVLNGGGAYITFPVTKGDSCLVLFCDREIDTWFTKGGTNAPQSARVHDLNDGIALVGIKNTGNFISSYFSGLKIFYGSGYLTIDNSGNIVINSPGNTNITATGNVTVQGATVNINP